VAKLLTGGQLMGKITSDRTGQLKPLYQYLVSAPGRLAAGCRRHFIDISAGWKEHWKKYLLQSLAATIVIFIIFFAVTPERPVIVASIGASTFIVFAMPCGRMAQPKSVVGGHIIGIFCGSLFSFFPQMDMLPLIAVYSASVGLSMFLMVTLNLEHPPASATALGIALNRFSIALGTAIILSALVLALAHFLLCRRFDDLTI
jgi:CBS-domain-containing membrane protein